MFRKGPTEKDKIFQKLTEKEIKDQLYGFNTRPREIIKEQESVKPVKKEETAKEPKEPKNPYFGIQIILLAVFLILIWISVRQIIRVISRPRPPQQAAQQKAKQKPLQQKNVNTRRR